MDRKALDKMTLEQLRKEAEKAQLQSASSNSRDVIMESLLNNWERQKAWTGRLCTRSVSDGSSSSGKPSEQHPIVKNPVVSQAASIPPAIQCETPQPIVSPQPEIISADSNPGQAAMASMLSQMMAAVTQCMNQQQQFMQQHQVVMQYQQQVLQQISFHSNQNNRQFSSSTTSAGTASADLEPNPSQPVIQSTGVAPPTHERTNQPNLSTVASSNAVSILASQIPEFSGSERENIDLWIRRVDQVASIHNAADNIILLAASSKLTRDARR